MGIKKIEAICKAARRIAVLWGDECQWIGDGSAFYPVHGLPPMTESNIFALFDISEDKQSKFLFSESEVPTTYDFSDSCESEVPLVREGISVIWRGAELIPLKTSEGITFVNRRYLKPLEDGENEYILCERTAKNGQVYIVAKRGFLIAGAIMPAMYVDKEFVENLKVLYELSAAKLSGGVVEPVQMDMELEDEENE